MWKLTWGGQATQTAFHTYGIADRQSQKLESKIVSQTLMRNWRDQEKGVYLLSVQAEKGFLTFANNCTAHVPGLSCVFDLVAGAGSVAEDARVLPLLVELAMLD